MPGTIVRPRSWQDRPPPADTESHAIPLSRRFSPSPVALSCGAPSGAMGRTRRAVGCSVPAGRQCRSPVPRRVQGRAAELRERDVKGRAGGVAEGWRASRCGRLLTEPGAAPVLFHATRRRGWAAQRRARPLGGAGALLRAWSLRLLFHVEQRQLGGARSLASAAPRQRRRRVVVGAGAPGAGAGAGPQDVPRGTSGHLPHPPAARPPRKWGRGPAGRP